MTDNVNDYDLELDEGNVDEAHDPKMAPQNSAELVARGADKVSRAPKRKGDKSNSESMDRDAMFKAISKKIDQMNDAGIAQAYKNMFGESNEFNAASELKDLVESEATLSEEFKEKTEALFEAALSSAIVTKVDELEEAYEEALTEEIAVTSEELVGKIDGYLTYVVENWMEENSLAIHNGLRTEIAEDFMIGLKDLFTESYIEVPESKVDLVDDLADTVDSLEEELNTTRLDAIKLAEEVEFLEREAIISEAAADLADTQAEKLYDLVDTVEFHNAGNFADKVAIIKESHFTKKTSSDGSIEEVLEEGNEMPVETSDRMASYLTALRQNT